MNPLNIQRDIHNSLLISFYLDLIPVSLISLPYPYSFLTLSTISYDLVYIFYCCTFVVHCCYPLVSPLKCEYSYTVYTVVKFHLLAKQAANGTCIKCVKCYHGIESTSADLAQSQNCLGIEALDLTGEGDINEIDDIDSNDVPSSSSFHVFQCQLIENL